MRRDFLELCILDLTQQQTRVVVPALNSNIGRGHSQGGRRENQQGCSGRDNDSASRGAVHLGNDVVHQDEKYQFYSFLGKTKAETSD